MRRRKFIMFLGGAAVAWPLTTQAQQRQRVWRIGVLLPGSKITHGAYLAAFRKGLGERGYIEDRNFVLDVGWAEGRLERLPALAEELVSHKVDLIVVGSSQGTFAARQVTATIPIVQAAGGDFVANGLAVSLAHPGGNVTGLLNEAADLSAKQMQTLASIVPGMSRIGILIDPTSPTDGQRRANVEDAARALGLMVRLAAISKASDLEDALEGFSRDRIDGLVVLKDAIFVANSRRIVEFSAKARLPAIYTYRSLVAEGGLVSYGVDLANNYHSAARFVDRILKGDRPSDLPVEQPTKFELVINLKTARALGLDVPPTLLARADEVIE
jgi:putative tryptophan/tyrosine transport system substrate-binding protein